jgi:hypothetical protein
MGTPPPDRTPVRGYKGRIVENPNTIERDAQAYDWHLKGKSSRQIAALMGWADHSSALDAIDRARTAKRATATEAQRADELARLDLMNDRLQEVLDRRHVTVSQGKVVKMDGQPVEDDGPILDTVRTLLQVQARRAKLLGLDAPASVAASVEVSYKINGVDPGDMV